jgi:glycosyltransferase involved in cell wall biosynthesis
MRICVVNEFFYPDDAGGTGTVLSGLTRTLRDEFPDVEIDVVTSRHLYRTSNASQPRYEEWGGIRIIRLNTPCSRQASTVRRLAANVAFSVAAMLRLLWGTRYDLILVSTAPPTLAMAAYVVQRLRGTPYNYIIYDLEPDRALAMKILPEQGLLARALKRAQRSWLQSASHVVVLGRCMRDRLVTQYQMRHEDIAIIPIGADPDEVAPMERASRFRTTHDLQGFVALYSGNFGRYHNFDTILDAARALRDVRNDITFVMVGAGAQQAHIARRIQEERLCNVRLYPFVPQHEYSDLLASADVSLVTLEAGIEGICVPSKFYSILASGRPSIAMMGRNTEIAMVIEETDCGVILDQEDTEGLIATLCRLAASPDELERMGRNARRTLIERFTTQDAAEAYYRSFDATLQCAAREPQGKSI